MVDGDFEGNKLGIFDGHTLGEANRDLLGMTDQDAVETLLSSCMLDDLSCGKMCHPHFCHGFVGVVLVYWHLWPCQCVNKLQGPAFWPGASREAMALS